MLCDNCNKNEATIHYTEVINNTRREHHLCKECMTQEMSQSGDMDFPLAKLIRGIFSAHLNGIEQGAAASMQLTCDKCGMTYEDFMKIGKFGCAECYSVFGPLIVDNIKKLQGNSTHTGKRYRSFVDVHEADFLGNDIEGESAKEVVKESSNSISAMQKQLQKALEIEDYEEAARLRDAIKLAKERVGKDA